MSIIQVINENKAELDKVLKGVHNVQDWRYEECDCGDITTINVCAENIQSKISSSTLKLLEAVRESIGEDIEGNNHYCTNLERLERQRILSLLDEAITSITTNNK